MMIGYKVKIYRHLRDNYVSTKDVNTLSKESSMDIAISDFARRHTPSSAFSYFQGTSEQLVTIVKECFDNATPGYKEGILCVPVPVDNFFSAVVQLKSGDRLEGEFVPRVPTEDPRKHINAVEARRGKLPAKYVEIILYSREALMEDPSHVSLAEWEVVSINASPTYTPTPITPRALCNNHFEQSGGTSTGYTPEEFEAAMKESFLFWKDKAMLKG